MKKAKKVWIGWCVLLSGEPSTLHKSKDEAKAFCQYGVAPDLKYKKVKVEEIPS